ncbi:MAG: helix-turn-helix domain-containing protein [Bacteroidales bacterium]|nr:helix-turn-helix domain-containing protein [Bacteroidales bacterium]
MKTTNVSQTTNAEIYRLVKQLELRLDEIQANSLPWLDAADVCRKLKISKRSLDRYRMSGALPYSKIKRKIFYSVTDILHCLEDNRERKERML